MFGLQVTPFFAVGGERLLAAAAQRRGLTTTAGAADIDLIANAPADLAALLGDAEKLNEVREFHRNWGDQDADTLDGLDLWEQLGRLLGVTP